MEPISIESLALPKKPFRREGLGYVFDPDGAAVRLRADYIHQSRDDMKAEIVVESTLPGVAQHVLRTTMNLLVDARLLELSKQLEIAIPNQVKWLPIVRSFAEAVIRSERAGEPFMMVGQRPMRLRPPERVERILVEGKDTLLYGPGGAGKGYLAAGMAVCVQAGIDFAGLSAQQGNVLYLDWEDDPDELDERIKEVSRGFGIEPPNIHYRWMRDPLPYNVQPIARYIDEHAIRLVIVDSFELACGASGDRGTYEESAKRLFQALKQFGLVSRLLIDHVSEAARTNKTSVNKAYGAIFKANWARRAFEVKVDSAPGERINHIGLYTFKTNRGEIGAPIGIAVDFKVPGAVSFYREDIRDNPTLSEALPLVEKIAHVIKEDGPSTVKAIHDCIGGDQTTVRVTLNRWKNKRFTRLDDGRWALFYPGPAPSVAVLRTPDTEENEWDV